MNLSKFAIYSKRNISHNNLYSTSNDSLDYHASSGLETILKSYSGSYIPNLELEHGFSLNLP